MRDVPGDEPPTINEDPAAQSQGALLQKEINDASRAAHLPMGEPVSQKKVDSFGAFLPANIAICLIAVNVL